MSAPVVGIDGYAGGWVAVSWRPAAPPRVEYGKALSEVIDRVEESWGETMACVAIDMPIGLPEQGVRPSDAAVRAVLGPRRASLFATPVRSAVYAADWAQASAAQRALAGVGLSKQSFALRHGIIQVADWLSGTGRIAYEVHPELSFAVLAGLAGGAIAPMRASKTTWAGQHDRAALLRVARMLPGSDIGAAGLIVPPADVLDAAVAAWSAARIAAGRALRFPAVATAGAPRAAPAQASAPDPLAVWA